MRKLIIPLITITSAVTTNAAIIAQYDFETLKNDNSADTELNSVAADTVTPSSSPARSGGGGSTGPVGHLFWNTDNASNTNLANAITNNVYLGFTVSINAGFEADLTNLTFAYGDSQSGTGTMNLAVFSNIGGFTAGDEIDTLTWTQNSTANAFSLAGDIDLSGAAFQNATAPIEFRIYAFDDITTPGQIRFDTLVLNGDVVAVVPEPSSTALLGLGGLALILRRRK